MDETTSRDFSRMLTSARRRVHNARLRTTYGYLDYARQSTPPAAAEGPRLDERCGAIETEALEANFGFVDAQARRFSQVRPDLHDDLVQAGLGALLAAFRDWDPERASLIRFADRVIMKAINDATRKAERPDLSYGLWCQRPRVLSAAAVLRDRLGRAASVDEVARESGCTPNVVRRILATRTVACDAARTRTLSAFAQTRLPWAVAIPRLDAPREGLHDLYDVLAANEETDRDDLCLGDLTRGVDYLEAAAWMLRLWGFELGEIAAFTTLDRETARRAIVRTEDYVSGTGGASSAARPTRGSVLVGDPAEEAGAFAQALGDLVAGCDLVSAARGAQRSPDQVIAFVREFGSWLGKARHAVCPRAPLPPEIPNTIRRAWDHAASADVTDEHLRRFFQRRNRTPLAAGERVLVAWQLARAGRLGEIDRAHPFGSALVEDIGLLDLHLAVTRDAYATLDAAAAARPVGREQLTEALNALSWLHEAEVRRALDALDALCTAGANDVADAGRNLLRRLRHLACEPRPCGAADLSEAQVRRHLPSVGLPLLGELNGTRPTRLRQRLLGTARRADVDQLLPAAQIAEARGELAEFLDALAA